MIQNKMIRFAVILFSLFSIAFIGCGGGGSDSPAPAPPTPNLQVLPADFNFDIVTNGNTVDDLEVTIKNSGTASLSVSDISLSGAEKDNFVLNLNGGTSPCGAAPTTIAAGNDCTVTVEFDPQSIDTFSADLTIVSNDPTDPTYNMSLMGTKANISAIDVTVNQVVACPRGAGGGLATAYVSVADQGGFPVSTLLIDDFSITEDTNGRKLTNAVKVDDSVTLSVALLMDYSFSIVKEDDNVSDMEDAAKSFVDQLGANDEAEIIKYASEIEVTQEFTSTMAELITAIESTPTVEFSTTKLFDAITRAVTDISASTKDRRAIIVITDGKDDDGTGNPVSDSTLEETIAAANTNGVPVFTVGLGSADTAVLLQMANETGGSFSDSTTSDNLATIYQQLADLLFTNQYILTYNTTVPNDVGTVVFGVEATYAPGITGTATKTILACD
jgi:VWFA-related protein